MKKVAILMPNGYEEIEALTVVDLLRRAGLTIDMVSVIGSLNTVGDHGIQVRADILFEEAKWDDYQMLVTPGGMTGTLMLAGNQAVLRVLQDFHRDEQRYVASICASPIVLAAAGISQESEGTCYPGCEEKVQYKVHHDTRVYQDNHLITSQGPGTAMEFALQIIRVLDGEEKQKEIAAGLLWQGELRTSCRN